MKGYTLLEDLISSNLILFIWFALDVACLAFDAFAENRLTKV